VESLFGLEENRHAVVDVDHLTFGVTCEDHVATRLAKARHQEQTSVFSSKEVGLVDSTFSPPFEKPVSGHQTSAIAKCIAKHPSAFGRLGASVDHDTAAVTLQPPECIGQYGPVVGKIDHGVGLSGCHVVPRPKLDSSLAKLVEWETAEQRLFVGAR
jgi:hypothetical protein